MVITQTPLRISLAGGGTDLQDFFRREGGAVLTLAIDKYVFVVVKERFDEQYVLNYSKREAVDSIEDMHHDLVREAARMTSLGPGVEITTLADIPSEGSGLGSSSCVTVGLLNAFWAYQGVQVTSAQLAEAACEIEIDTLGRPVGKQDQYIAAYGGMRFIEFPPQGGPTIGSVRLTDSQKRRLASHLVVFYLQRTRSADAILGEQKRNIAGRLETLRSLKAAAHEARALLEADRFGDLGPLLDRTWRQKSTLATGITSPEIDAVYERGLRAGATGGKVIGAGGGGFILFFCPKERQDALREELADLRELPFMLEPHGSKVVFHQRRYAWK